MQPRALRLGNTIGILAPSWGGPAAFPHRVERGLDALHAFQMTLPLGCRAEMATDEDKARFSLVAAAVQ